jgi:GNAT superfamily N-acetyltransferase
MEVRPIRSEESEAFLHLLCEVFGLDYSRAHGIFFNEPMFDLQRKWALFDAGEMVSIMTTVPLHFGWGNAIGIAGVATRHGWQGQGCAQRLLESVLECSCEAGEGPALLFAREQGLYRRAGFTILDEVVRARIECSYEDNSTEVLSFPEVSQMYTLWAEENPARLRRDERRWKYWRWTLRMCAPIGDGYACMEGGMLRECVVSKSMDKWPLGANAEWFGTSSMAAEIGFKLHAPLTDLYLMGYKIPLQPQMFMTDQF